MKINYFFARGHSFGAGWQWGTRGTWSECSRV